MGADEAKTRTLYLCFSVNVSLGTEKHSETQSNILRWTFFAKIFNVNRKPLSQDASP